MSIQYVPYLHQIKKCVNNFSRLSFDESCVYVCDIHANLDVTSFGSSTHFSIIAGIQVGVAGSVEVGLPISGGLPGVHAQLDLMVSVGS